MFDIIIECDPSPAVLPYTEWYNYHPESLGAACAYLEWKQFCLHVIVKIRPRFYPVFFHHCWREQLYFVKISHKSRIFMLKGENCKARALSLGELDFWTHIPVFGFIPDVEDLFRSREWHDQRVILDCFKRTATDFKDERWKNRAS